MYSFYRATLYLTVDWTDVVDVSCLVQDIFCADITMTAVRVIA